LCLQRT
jgi:hypothetical protein